MKGRKMALHLANYYRDTWVEVDLDAINSNILNLKKALPIDTKIIAVIKANAYGHGYHAVAKEALSAGATMLAVAFLDEAVFLRKSNIEAPVLVLGPTRPADIVVAAKWNIVLTAISLEWLEEASRIVCEKSTNIHLKIDTGMNRTGVKGPIETKKATNIINECKHLKLQGAYTHFATADQLDNSYFEKQYKELLEIKQVLPKNLFFHISNSATI